MQLLSIGLVCASVLYLSLLSTILYYIWKHTNKNKSLTKSIRIVNGTCYTFILYFRASFIQ